MTDEAGETPADVVAVFVRDSAEVETWVAKAAAAVTPNGLLWVVYPTGRPAGTDINRDILRERLEERGLTSVAMVSYDERWSAIRFRTS